MNEEKLDRILQQTLTPEVSDEEIKVKFEQGECHMKKKKNYIRPAVALAACAALVIGIGFGNLPERILSNAVMSHKTVAPIKDPSQNMENGFVMKVRAAEVKELEKGKAQVAVYSEKSTGEAWSGSDNNNKVAYEISLPLICEGKNMDTITYSVNKGCFRIIQPKNDPYVIEGKECKKLEQVSESVDIKIAPDGSDKMEEKYYRSYTISAKDQDRKDVEVYLCDEKTLSEKLYKQLWDNNSDGVTEQELAAEAAVKNKVMGDPQVTCKISYQENQVQKTETAKVAVRLQAMTYKEAAGSCKSKSLKKKLELMKDMKGIFVVLERL